MDAFQILVTRWISHDKESLLSSFILTADWNMAKILELGGTFFTGISFIETFNQKIEKNILPFALKSLTFGANFDRSPVEGVLLTITDI